MKTDFKSPFFRKLSASACTSSFLRQRYRGFRSQRKINDTLLYHKCFPISSLFCIIPDPIAADTGASPELVCNGKTGLIYHRDEPRSLADRITQLYRDPALLGRLSRNAHRAAERRFSAEINYQKTLAVYRKVLAGAV